jgi:eukaryotic-like serine/threonine-protein kinase
VLKALAKEASERYGTAQELAEDLRRFLDDRPIRARRPSVRDYIRKWARRHKTVVAAGMVVLLVATAAFGVSALLVKQQRDDAIAKRWETRQAVDDMYTEFAEKVLARHPYLERVHRDFLEKALASYERFAQDEGSDPLVRFGVAKASLRVGE